MSCMQITRRFAILLTVGLLGACSGGELPALGEPRPLYLPAGSNTMSPRLAVAPDGVAVLSWLQRDEAGATLRYSTFAATKWQAATDVVTDPDMFVNWADIPSVTPLNGDHWVAHWLSKSAEETYAYDVLVAQSMDGGQSWSDPVRPHTDDTPTEHGFVSMHAEGDAVSLLWLDGRNTASDPSDGVNGMTLRSAVLDRTGALLQEHLVDDLVCDCCQTGVAVSSKGPVAVYRDRTVDEIRDIYVARFIDGDWQPGVAIADDGWHIEGCPVNGPAIAALGDLVAIAWFSAANDRTVVRAALSTNAGRTFGKPVEIASLRASGHVGLAIVDRSAIVVSWVESDKRGTNAINIRGMTRAGTLGRKETVGRSTLSRIYPQLARLNDKLLLAWTDEIGDASEVVSIEVPILGFYDR